MNRERGISYVAGVVIDLANLLRDFKIENNDPVDMADKIEMVTPLMRPYGCGPVAPSHRRFSSKVNQMPSLFLRYPGQGMGGGHPPFKLITGERW